MDSRIGKLRLRLIIAATAAAAAHTPVLAQQAGDRNELEEIVVTAQFRETKLQSTPIAITAITDEMLRSRSQFSLMQVTQSAPNVEMQPGALAFGPALNVYIRGVGQDDFLPNVEPGVAMYVDDVYHSTLTATNWDLVDLERIEILRGPQGTTAGRNAIGGAVRLITKKPTGEGGGFAQVLAGDYDRVGVQAGADLALIKDMLFARVSGVTDKKDGYMNRIDFACAKPNVAAKLGIGSANQGGGDCKLGTLGGKDYSGGRVALRWLPSDDWEVNVAADRTNDDSEGAALTVMEAVQSVDPQYGPWFVTGENMHTFENFIDPNGGGRNDGTPINFTPINEFVEQGASLIVDYKISESLQLKSISAWRDLDSEFGSSTDGAPTVYGEYAYNTLTQDSFQQELRLNGSTGPIDWTLGGFYFDRDIKNVGRIDIRYLPFPPFSLGVAFDFISHQAIDAESKAVFAHGVWHISEQMNLTAGARWSDEEKEQTETRLDSFTLQPSTSPAFADFIANGGSLTRVFEDDRMDYRVSLDYQFTEDFMAYASVSTGYKSGGANARPFFGSQFVVFEPEEVLAYEVGFKADLLDDSMRLNTAVFLNEYDEMQLVPLTCDDISPFPGAPCAAPRNLADADISGFEAELLWYPVDGLQIDASVGWIEMEINRVDPAAIGPVDPDLDTPENTPEWKYNIGVQYEISLGEYGSLTPRIDYFYTDDRTGLGTSDYVIDSYELVNARVSWRAPEDRWELALLVTNLTDEWYLYNAFDLTGAGAAWLSAHPATPREYAMTLRYNW